MQEVGLAQPGRPVDEQRVVRPRRALGDRQRGGVREAVRRADDELVEGVAGVQRPRAARAAPLGAAGRGGRSSVGDGAATGAIVRRAVGADELFGSGRGVDEQLDVERDAGEGLERVGEQPEVAGADALDGDRARDAEDERVLVSRAAWTPWNQVFQVASASWARTAAATLAQRSSAAGVPTSASPVLSTGLSTSVEKRSRPSSRSTVLGRVPRVGGSGKSRRPGPAGRWGRGR